MHFPRWACTAAVRSPTTSSASRLTSQRACWNCASASGCNEWSSCIGGFWANSENFEKSLSWSFVGAVRLPTNLWFRKDSQASRCASMSRFFRVGRLVGRSWRCEGMSLKRRPKLIVLPTRGIRSRTKRPMVTTRSGPSSSRSSGSASDAPWKPGSPASSREVLPPPPPPGPLPPSSAACGGERVPGRAWFPARPSPPADST
mmetsp:Transcript_14076/g.41354  ORF Transcript_14076/g.41354 Transcript_14076/m.41354 type:complete len:202 (-) Transcript_14076:1929-2534(-)